MTRLLRRALALAALAALLAGCGPGRFAPLPPEHAPRTRAERIALYAETVRAYQKAGWLPVIDLEADLAAWKNPALLVEAMNRQGVALAAVTADKESAIHRAVELFPNRLVPLTTEAGEKRWAYATHLYLDDQRRQLGAGAFGIGDVAFEAARRHSDTQLRVAREALEALLRLAVEKKAPVLIRMAPEDAVFGVLERQLRTLPQARVVLTQAGLLPDPAWMPGYGQALLRAMSLRHPELFFTLTLNPPPPYSPVPRVRHNLLYDPGGSFSPEWGALLESRVSRFMMGSGPASADGKAYVAWTKAFREHVLGALSPSVREAIAYQNAWRLLTGEPWRK